MNTMWIEDTTTCDSCGTEVTLYTDGRLGYAITGWIGNGAEGPEADTQGDDIWRNGHLIEVACPAYERGDTGHRCHNTIAFTGEGVNIPGRTDSVAEFALPILEEAP